MKRCPECGREYDNSMMFCLDDGTELLYGPGAGDEPATAILSVAPAAGGLIPVTDRSDSTTAIMPRRADPADADSSTKQDRVRKSLLVGSLLLGVVVIGVVLGYRYFSPIKQIESIAVMPFVNESGNADVEYLSDGMTETLINSLSKVPKLSVKARSSVFRYKGKEADARQVGAELNVQAY